MSLGLTYNQIKAEVERTLGTYADADVSAIIDRGLRQFYTPMPLSGERVMHRWSFLKTVQTLDTHNSTSSHEGQVSSAGISSLNTGLLTTDVESISHVTVSDGTTTVKRLVVSIDGPTQFTIDSNTGLDGAPRTIEVFYNGTYALPASFAGIDGPIGYDTYYGTDPNIHDLEIPLMSDKSIRNMFQHLEDRDDKPRAASIYQTGATGTAGSSFRIRFYPVPDAVYRLVYDMINEPASLSGTQVPLGGDLHSETILASCLAIAEQYFIPNSPHGYKQNFMDRLRASVELDRNATRSENLGYSGDPAQERFIDARQGRFRPDNRVTVQGTQY
jgi:hypothetical protein